MDIEAKKKIVQKAISDYEKKTKRKVNIGFGNVSELTYIPTQFITLNELLGGGIPRGQVGVVAGPAMTAKTTLLLQIIAYNQRIDPNFVALWTDAENCLVPEWLTEAGVDLDRFIIQKSPEDHDIQHMEEYLEEGLALAKTRAIDMWVVDSIGGLIPSAEVNKELVEGKMLDMQRKFGEFFRKAIGILSPRSSENKEVEYKGCALVLIGQVYTVPSTHVSISEVRGGNAVKHWAFWRLITRRGSKDAYTGATVNYQVPGLDKTKAIQSGWSQYLKLEKTKINDKESREIVLQFKYGVGLDDIHCTISALLARQVVVRTGAWYNHELLPDGRVQGKEALYKLLTEDEQLRTKLASLLTDSINGAINDEIRDTESGPSDQQTT